MTPAEFQAQLTALLAQSRNRPLSASQIAATLHLKGKERKHVRKWLNECAFQGRVVKVRGDRYALPAEVELVTGVLQVARSGDGWVTREDGAEVFVRGEAQGTALPGDTVAVRPDPFAAGPRGKPAGSVVRVLERARRDIVGTLRSTGRLLYVVPLDPVYSRDLYVPDAGGATVGQRVVARFADWPNRHVNPEGQIVEVLGPADKPSVDTVAVMRHYGLPERFSAAVRREAESASAHADRPGPRADRRGQLVVTIDPERARDFDDALSLERDAEGRRVLGVHIADVSHFVRPGTALDDEARRRGNSAYLPDRVIPMLPEQLSNGVCSLSPDDDRLTFSALLTVDDRGHAVAARFERAVIRSRRRFTYEEAQKALDGGAADGESGALLADLNALARQMRARRFARHALDLDVPECEVEIGPDGALSGLRVVPNDESHHLVEECMVAANEAVAREIGGRRWPLISRVHEAPSAERLDDLAAQLRVLGIAHGDLSRREALAALLASVRGHPLAAHVRVAVLRSMNRAEYSEVPIGHFGLAKRHYCHFTSPIRRYPDLVVHRLLAAALEGTAAPPYDGARLRAVARGCSLTERRADDAERALVEIMKLRFLAAELKAGRPEVREGVVVDVLNFGMFVELPDLQIRGLVHVSAISDDYVRYSRRRRALRAGRDTFAIGRRIPVIVARVDIDKRQVDFAPA
ncbi:MAG: ribonuclease R [Lentisphaerae bacterium]|nr:ribonuclease R [Lentisphaerota bacterium]